MTNPVEMRLSLEDSAYMLQRRVRRWSDGLIKLLTSTNVGVDGGNHHIRSGA